MARAVSYHPTAFPAVHIQKALTRARVNEGKFVG